MTDRSVQNPSPDGLGNGVTDGVGEADGPADGVGGEVEVEVGVGVGASEPPQAARRSDTSSATAAVLRDNGG